jgi:predicted DNA-binding protein (MmcQ/YjbR family)
MTRAEFNAFCAALPATTHVVQWGGADVWKVGDKVFAIRGRADGRDAFTFKVGEIAFEVLPETPGLRPAPYLASRGLKWIQDTGGGLSDEDLRAHVRASHAMIAAKLPKRRREALGL